jgi:hypothetical protein
VLVFADRDEIGDSTFTTAEIGNIPSTKLLAIIGLSVSLTTVFR